MRVRFVVVTGMCLAALAALEAQQLRPGRWETTAEMQMDKMSMPPMTTSRCITAEELKRDPTGGAGNGPGQSDCKATDHKTVGNTTTWKMACTGAQPMTGEGTMTVTGDAYASTMVMRTGRGTMNLKAKGRRLGDCSK